MLRKIIKYIPLILVFLPVSLKAQYDFTADVTEGCDSLTVHFTFTSSAPVDTIIWDLSKPGGYDTTYSVTDTLTAKFKDPNNYTILVYLKSAEDTPVVKKIDYIKVHHTVTADFTEKDTSQIAPNSFYFEHVNQPYDVFATYIYTWNFDDGNTGNGEDITHTFTSPGTYNVSLNVTDNYGCSDTKSIPLTVLAPPPVPDITANVTEGCDSLNVLFRLINVDTDTIYTVVWDFGNGTSGSGLYPDTVLYLAGNTPTINYSVRAIINGVPENTIEKTDFITIHRSVSAVFNCVDTLSNSTSIIKVCYSLDPLFDTAATYLYTWQMEGFSDNNDIRPLYTFANEPDTVTASLTIEDLTNGCSNISVQNVILTPEITVQNVFTPNNDGLNDFFVVNSNGTVLLNLKIYTRSGLLVFDGSGTEIVWDGRTESGIKLETGIYFYILTSSKNEDPLGKYNKTGFIYLFR